MSTSVRTVAMVAYANYFTDARIKNYVDALIDAGVHVDVFALGRERGISSEGNLRVYTLGQKYAGTSTAANVVSQAKFMLQAFGHLLVKSRYDIIHVHNMPDILALVGLPFRLRRTKVILDVHDTMPEAYATKFGYALDSLPIRLIVREERVSAACSNCVITTNRMHKEVLAGHGIPDSKIELIYNVGNTKLFKPRNHVANGEELWLGYHGTIARRLGVFLIIDALFLLKEDCPGLRFLCIGEGDDLEEMQQRAAKNGVTHMVEWKPFTDVEKLPEALQRVQVGIIGNQRDTELKRNYMLPVKMLEYAAMEIPTIAPRLKVLERYFEESSAFFYEPDSASALAECIRSIYCNRAMIATRIAGLKTFNTTYNWNIMAERYLQILNNLVG